MFTLEKKLEDKGFGSAQLVVRDETLQSIREVKGFVLSLLRALACDGHERLDFTDIDLIEGRRDDEIRSLVAMQRYM